MSHRRNSAAPSTSRQSLSRATVRDISPANTSDSRGAGPIAKWPRCTHIDIDLCTHVIYTQTDKEAGHALMSQTIAQRSLLWNQTQPQHGRARGHFAPHGRAVVPIRQRREPSS